MASAGEAKWRSIVLDVNGLLLEKIYDPRGLFAGSCCVRMGQFSIFVRPSAKEFVQWCVQRFNVIVWSTSQKRTLEPLLPLIFSHGSSPSAVMDQTNCVFLPDSHPDCPGKPLFIKRFPPELWSGCGEDNLLLIDDACYKAALNPPGTSVHPPPWSHTSEDGDIVLGQLREVLSVFLRQGAAAAADEAVRSYAWSSPATDRLYMEIQEGAVA